MAFKLIKGRAVRRMMPVTASTTIAAGAIVSYSSGRLIAATSSTANTTHEGVLEKAIAATDTDYAATRDVSVIVPIEKNTVWEGDVTSGLVAADVGLEVDLTDASTINRGASSVDVAKVVSVISSTKGTFLLKLNGAY